MGSGAAARNRGPALGAGPARSRSSARPRRASFPAAVHPFNASAARARIHRETVTRMPIRELGDLAWEEVRDLDRARTVAVLPVGAIEAHGPHLPLGTDVVIAQAMARAGAALIERQGLGVLLLPPLPFTAAPFGAAFAGTLSVAAPTVTGLVVELARELARHGFAALAIAN